MNNNIDKNKILESVLNSSASDADRKEFADAIKKGDKSKLINSLSDKDKATLNAVLNDKNALEAALKSPQARAIMKSLFGGKNG